jgi:hypothetical protein
VLTAIEKEDGMVLVSPDINNTDTMVILCGCARACGNKEETRARAKRTILVAGETIDMTPNIRAALTEELRRAK